MKNIKIKWLSILLLPTLLSVVPSLVTALEFDEVREFGEVFKISAQANSRERIELSWEIADDYYLYNNKFLRFKTETSGVVLGEPEIPAGEREFDDLLGEEVIKYHGRLTIGLPLESVPPGVDQISLKTVPRGAWKTSCVIHLLRNCW